MVVGAKRAGLLGLAFLGLGAVGVILRDGSFTSLTVAGVCCAGLTGFVAVRLGRGPLVYVAVSGFGLLTGTALASSGVDAFEPMTHMSGMMLSSAGFCLGAALPGPRPRRSRSSDDSGAT